jgi:hypothetical protein
MPLCNSYKSVSIPTLERAGKKWNVQTANIKIALAIPFAPIAAWN